MKISCELGTFVIDAKFSKKIVFFEGHKNCRFKLWHKYKYLCMADVEYVYTKSRFFCFEKLQIAHMNIEECQRCGKIILTFPQFM